MDKNLFLLTRKEHIVVQEIDHFRGLVLGGDFEFASTRNNVDLIIISKDPNIIRKGLGENISEEEINRLIRECEEEETKFLSTLDREEEEIRRAIDCELERRRQEETPEERPHLPNYEDREERIPHDGEWEDDYDNFPYDDEDDLGRWIDRLEYQRNDIISLSNELRRIEQIQEPTQWDRRRANDIESQLNTLYLQQITSDFENFYSDDTDNRYTNFQLKLLDDNIRKIREYRSRLNAGNLLGRFTRNYDSEGREKRRVIHLFLDNIEVSANRLNVNDRIEIIANVYIHELLHAYYSQSLKDRYALVNCINDMEEAMAEFGMLSVIQEALPQYLNTAQRCVREKWNTPSLRCYGLGAYLYDAWNQPNNHNCYFNGKILSVYQNIQMSIRNSRRKISSLKRALLNTPCDERRCILLVYYLLYLHACIKRDNTQHYFFNGKTFGCNNRMSSTVLEYYIQHCRPSYQDFQKHFRGSFGLMIPSFIDQTNITNANRRQYDLDNIITLADGTNIVLKRAWRSGRGGETVVFMKDIDRLYRMGLLDKHVLYLG